MRTSKPLRRESVFSRWTLPRRLRSARNSCLLSNGWAVSGTLRRPATERSSISRAGAGRKGPRASLRSAPDPESRSTARLEHCAYRLVDILQEHEIDFFLRLRRDFLKVLAVARRQHHAADPGAHSGKHFFLDPAYGDHQAEQADLASHSRVGAYGPRVEER